MKELNKGYEFTKAQIAELESLRAENAKLKADVAAEVVQQIAEGEIWKELETLRARLAELEAQEPVGEIVRTETSHGCDRTAISWLKYPYAKYGAKLYLSPVVSPLSSTSETDVEKLKAENQSLKNEAAFWKQETKTWADKHDELAESFQCHPNKPVIERLEAELAKATSELEASRKDAERRRGNSVNAWSN